MEAIKYIKVSFITLVLRYRRYSDMFYCVKFYFNIMEGLFVVCIYYAYANTLSFEICNKTDHDSEKLSVEKAMEIKLTRFNFLCFIYIYYFIDCIRYL